METALLKMQGILGPVSSNKHRFGAGARLRGRTEIWGLFLIKEIIQ